MGLRFSEFGLLGAVSQGVRRLLPGFHPTCRGAQKTPFTGIRAIKTATSQNFVDWTEGRWLDYLDAPLKHFVSCCDGSETCYLSSSF